MRLHLDNEPLMALYIRICAGWQIPILHTRNGEHTANIIKGIASQNRKAGNERPITQNHIMVIAPINTQIANLKSAFDSEAQVGTIDLLQGREAQ